VGVTLLLDTHTLLWALTDPDKLSAEARTRVEDSSTILLVSTASAWEVATKYRLSKLTGADAIMHTLDQHLARLGARVLPIDLKHALLAGRLEHPHRDPFDRMIAAQAILEGVSVISRDHALSDLGASRVW
jgi:PIN domain nuclease of toxin-antitoxin system